VNVLAELKDKFLIYLFILNMHYSKVFPKTRRDNPKENNSPGTNLLIRCGLAEQLAAGLWLNTPLGLMVRRKVETIVREEMNRAEAIEVEIPLLHPKELWDETGRFDKYKAANISFTTQDRKGAKYILAPTAEEAITNFARKNLLSYRDLPVNFWQMGPKFRDELRPRQGLIRGREFLMKDAYSFDVDSDGMVKSFKIMEATYKRIFERLNFNYIQVEADSGTIGGSGSSEFMAITECGEDTLLYCPDCHYGGNQEKAIAYFYESSESLNPLTKIATPDIKTVEELEKFTSIPAKQMVKTIILEADGNPVIVSMRGDLEISEFKLAKLLKAENVETADQEIVKKVTGAPVGFAGPINLFGKTDVPYFFDISVKHVKNFLCGANSQDIHFINVNSGRDFPEPKEYHDLSKAVEGSYCSNCKKGMLKVMRGVELGHIFQLQQSYSQPMKATFSDKEGNVVPFWMGCYGIGVSRIVQTIIEQFNDERGIIWPLTLAPFKVVVIPVNFDEHLEVAEDIYKQLLDSGIEVIIDDRDARIGEKLTTAELLGWPVQILIGRSWDKDKKLEVRWRDPKKFDENIFSKPENNSLPTAEMELSEVISWLKKL